MENQEKFECADCGCFYWVDDRDSLNVLIVKQN